MQSGHKIFGTVFGQSETIFGQFGPDFRTVIGLMCCFFFIAKKMNNMLVV